MRFQCSGFELLEDRRLMAVYQDAAGWTVVDPSADTRTVYVSNSTGNDANDGLTQQTAKRTIAAGEALLRDGSPDWLLLQRGDTFTDENFGTLRKSGKNADEPLLIGAYGSGERPRVLTGGSSGLSLNAGDGTSFLAIIGIELFAHNRPTIGTPTGLFLFGNGSDLIVEDNKISGYASNLSVQGLNFGDSAENISIRRNVITDAWSASSHSQGMYASKVDGLLVEENFFDHNGWNESIVGAEATIYNHNMYLTAGGNDGVLDNVVVRGNISSRASSLGLKFQPNKGTHVIENNLFVRNVNGIALGGGKPQFSTDPADHVGIPVTATNNVILEGIERATVSGGFGVTFAHLNGGTFSNNIIANKLVPYPAGNDAAMMTADGLPAYETRGAGVRNFTIDSNVVYDWGRSLQVREPTESQNGLPVPVIENVTFTNNSLQVTNPDNQNPLITTYTTDPNVVSYAGNTYHQGALPASQMFRLGNSTLMSFSQWASATGDSGSQVAQAQFFDPTRGSESYAATLGITSYDNFMEQLGQLSRTNWSTALTADAINDYIREGFELDAVGVIGLPSPSTGQPPGGSSVQPMTTTEGDHASPVQITALGLTPSRPSGIGAVPDYMATGDMTAATQQAHDDNLFAIAIEGEQVLKSGSESSLLDQNDAANDEGLSHESVAADGLDAEVLQTLDAALAEIASFA